MTAAAQEQTVRAAIYARVSTLEQVDGTSLDGQRARCRASAESKGWEVVAEFVDEGQSGTKGNRPELDRLMAACARKDIDAVVVSKLDRFGRSVRHTARLVGELDDAGIVFVSVSESFDSSTPSGRLQRNILSSFAEFERDQIVERTSSGLRARAAEGHWPGGPPPFGFQIGRDPTTRRSTLVINEAEADVIRTAVRLIVDDRLSTWEAAARLNALGLMPRRSPKWTHHNLRRQLLDSRIAGLWHYGRGPGWGRGDTTTDIEVAIPALIDPERQAKLAAALAGTSSGPRDPDRDHFYLLSRGILKAPCGGNFHGVYRRDRGYAQYRCNNSRPEALDRCSCHRLRAETVDAAVWDYVLAILYDPDLLRSLATDYLGLSEAHTAGDALEELSKVTRRVTEAEETLARTATELVKAGLPAETIRRSVETQQTDLDRLKALGGDLQAAADRAERDVRLREGLEDLSRVAFDRLVAMDDRERRDVLDQLGVSVEVQGWDPCTACGGRGKTAGGTGGIPCDVCFQTKAAPKVVLAGRVQDHWLDANVWADSDGVPRPSTCCGP